MNGKQHKAVGVAVGAITTYVLMEKFGAGASVIVLPFASAAGAMLPDIDHDRTKLGSKRKVFFEVSSKIINTLIVLAFVLTAVMGVLIIKQSMDFGISISQLICCVIAMIVVLIVRAKIANSKTFKWACKHRGLMHTLFVPIILFVTSHVCKAPILHYAFVGLYVGYLSHLFVDMENTDGVPLLFPIIKFNIRIFKIPTKEESKCNVACIVTCMLYAIICYGYITYL